VLLSQKEKQEEKGVKKWPIGGNIFLQKEREARKKTKV